MNYSILQAIMAFIFGHKYYANIICSRGTDRYEVCSYIFLNRYQADMHRRRIEQTRSFDFIETISFRSRKEYIPVKG